MVSPARSQPFTVAAFSQDHSNLSLDSFRLLHVLQAVVHILYDGLIAALGAVGGGLIALPSLASEELRSNVAQVFAKAGHSLSG